MQGHVNTLMALSPIPTQLLCTGDISLTSLTDASLNRVGILSKFRLKSDSFIYNDQKDPFINLDI